jgi:hypothetical protein
LNELLEYVLYFLGKREVTMIFSTPIKEFVIDDKDEQNRRVLRVGFPNYIEFKESTFYEVLVDGNLSYLKNKLTE